MKANIKRKVKKKIWWKTVVSGEKNSLGLKFAEKIETNKMANKLVKTEAAWENFFEKADVNSDGSVSIDELKHILTVEYNQKLSDREIAVSVQIIFRTTIIGTIRHDFSILSLVEYYLQKCTQNV